MLPNLPDALGLPNPDRRLGARLAWGPPPSLQMADVLERLGTEWLVSQDDAVVLLAAGLAVRVASLTRELAELTA